MRNLGMWAMKARHLGACLRALTYCGTVSIRICWEEPPIWPANAYKFTAHLA